MNRILVANIGSTSFKFRLFDMPSERLLAKGGVERIGAAESPWKLEIAPGPAESGVAAFPDQEAAVRFVESRLAGRVPGGFGDLAAVGFKVVMARGVSGTQVLDERVLAAMEAFTPLAPAHNPAYVSAVRLFRSLFPKVPCIGTFETAFFDGVAPEYYRFPIPLAWEREHGVRRYGFHGASHRFVTERAAELLGRRDLRIISCHLGGSSSLAAVRGGVAVDSSWGMTTQTGLPHNNRTGDFDVCAAIYLARDRGLGWEAVEQALYKDAGLKGMSGLPSGDVRDVMEAAAAGNADARAALDAFVAQIRRHVGALLMALRGADALVFTAGIAENNPDLRARVCAGMEFCGLRLDTAANARVRAEEARISAADSKVEVWVIPTNEEIVIARNAWAKLAEGAPA